MFHAFYKYIDFKQLIRPELHFIMIQIDYFKADYTTDITLYKCHEILSLNIHFPHQKNFQIKTVDFNNIFILYYVQIFDTVDSF